MSVDISSESLPTVFLSRENDVTWGFFDGWMHLAYDKIEGYETTHSGDGDLQKG